MTVETPQVDLTWVKKIRTKYDEIRNHGEKYAVLRKCKNRLEPYCGQFTIEEVAKRVNILPSTMRKFESGGYELPTTLLSLLLKDLSMDEQRFRFGEVLAQPAYPPEKTETIPFEAPKPAPLRKVTVEPKTKIEIVNNTTESFIFSFTGEVLQIYEDTPENMKKGSWIAPADVIGGTKISPRKTIVN